MEIEIEFDDDIFLDVYKEINESDASIKLFYGGRDSGKSYNIAATLIKLCLDRPYFKCILIRKKYTAIRESQYELLKSFVDKHGLSDLFVFGKSHPLTITCANGNRFISKGLDDPEDVKSITNPSHAWYEEGNQLSREDYSTVSTTLRYDKGVVEEYFSFNPECDGDFRKFWIYEDLFSHSTNESFTWVKEIETDNGTVIRKIQAIHTTYKDNKYCTPDRSAKLEDLKVTSPYYYNVYCLGKWGARENESPFILTFDRAKHLSPKLERDKTLPIYLSFDFNRNPMCVSVIQTSGKKVRWLEVIKQPNTTIYRVLDYIKVKYPKAMFIVVGDYSGTTKQAIVKDQDESDYFSIIQAELGLSDGQMQQMPNPRIINNQVLVNYCLANLDVLHDERYCQPLIFDYENAQILADGTLKKTKREDPTQQLDALDTARYFYNNVFKGIDL